MISKAANEFIDLCMRYENMGWDHPDDSKTLKQIEAVAGKYMNNEEFRNRIEASKNDVVINRVAKRDRRTQTEYGVKHIQRDLKNQGHWAFFS